jgi:hypothetical protein
MIIWNREVTTPLCDLNSQKDLLHSILKIAKNYLKLEVNKIYGSEIFFNRVQSGELKKSALTLQIDGKEEVPIETNSDDGWNFNCSNHNYYNHSLTSNLGIEDLMFGENKVSALDEVYTFDFQAKYFLEQ